MAVAFTSPPCCLDEVFEASKTDFLAQRLQAHAAPAMKRHAVLLLNRSDEGIITLLALTARQIPRPRARPAAIRQLSLRRILPRPHLVVH